MIVISKYIIPKGFAGLAVYPFIFLKKTSLKSDIFLINHEEIHLKQQRETFILLFFFFYIMEWVIKLLIYQNTALAYKNISFEKEAYLNEGNINYLNNRKPWAFLNYI